MNNRTVLSFFGLVVVAGIVALIVAIMRDGSAQQQSGPAVKQGIPAASEKARVAPRVRSDKPAVDDGDTRLTPVADRPPTVYMTDAGVLVRDHRRKRDTPVEATGPRRSPTSSPAAMGHQAILAVRGALRPIVSACQAEQANSTASSSAAPTLQVVATVSVKNEQMTVEAVKVSESFEDAATGECVREKFTGRRLPAPGEPDVSGFEQTHRFRLATAAAPGSPTP